MSRIAAVNDIQTGAFHEDAVEVLVVGVLPGLATVAAEVEQPLLLVDLDDPAGEVGSRRDGVLQLSILPVEIEMSPAGALRPPDQLLAIIQISDALGTDRGRLESFLDQDLQGQGLWIEGAELDVS